MIVLLCVNVHCCAHIVGFIQDPNFWILYGGFCTVDYVRWIMYDTNQFELYALWIWWTYHNECVYSKPAFLLHFVSFFDHHCIIVCVGSRL